MGVFSAVVGNQLPNQLQKRVLPALFHLRCPSQSHQRSARGRTRLKLHLSAVARFSDSYCIFNGVKANRGPQFNIYIRSIYDVKPTATTIIPVCTAQTTARCYMTQTTVHTTNAAMLWRCIFCHRRRDNWNTIINNDSNDDYNRLYEDVWCIRAK